MQAHTGELPLLRQDEAQTPTEVELLAAIPFFQRAGSYFTAKDSPLEHSSSRTDEARLWKALATIAKPDDLNTALDLRLQAHPILVSVQDAWICLRNTIEITRR